MKAKAKKNTFLLFLKFFVICSIFVCSMNVYAVEFYWETPVSVSSNNSMFPSIAYSDKAAVAVWQEVEQIDQSRGQIWLSAQVMQNSQWITKPRFAGPFLYSGEIPSVCSVAVNNNGVVVVAVLSDIQTISIFTSIDNCSSFTETRLRNEKLPLVGPRVFRTSHEGFVLFATQGESESFTLVNSASANGFSWSGFTPFMPATGLLRAFVPTLTAFPGGDIVVFQASYLSGTRSSYQLYSAVSNDGARTWSAARLVTDVGAADGAAAFNSFHNQRPDVRCIDNSLYMTWERSTLNSDASQIYFVPLNAQGLAAGTPEKISSGSGACNRPVLFGLDSQICIIWFDTRRGIDTIYLAQKNNFLWNETRISKTQNQEIFGQPAVIDDSLHLFWQQSFAGGKKRIVRQSPDQTVDSAIVKPLSFTAGKRSSAEKVHLQVILPEDSSGVAGYSWIWTQDPRQEPPEVFMNLPTNTKLSLDATEDGPWYCKTKVMDYAGNWSSSTALSYYRDTTPPKKPSIMPLQLDDAGYLFSNSFPISWQNAPDEDDEVVGYTYSLEYLRPLDFFTSIQDPSVFALKPVPPPSRLVTAESKTSYVNRDNGLYAFSVAAIDATGNIGESDIVYFFMNKYVPYTVVSAINAKADDAGNIAVSVFGRGYLYDGIITEMYIDRDGVAPYDRVLTAALRQFTVTSDRKIENIQLTDLEEGVYRIGLLHSGRGLYMSAPLMRVTEFGTVKFGYFMQDYQPKVQLLTSQKHVVQISVVAVVVMCLFALIGMLVAIRGISTAVADTMLIRYEVQALLTGDIMPSEKRKKTATLKQRGMSLKYKLVFFTSFLVVMIILLISIPLGYLMGNTQEQTLAKGLEDRISVLMESLSSGVRAYMPAKNILELGYLPGQSVALDEAVSATIIGLPDKGNTTNLDYVWATNDPDILQKIDTAELVYGSSRSVDAVTIQIANEVLKLNESAIATVGEVSTEIEVLTKEGISLAIQNDPKTQQRRDEIQVIIRQLNARVTEQLNELSKQGFNSFPKYDAQKLSTDNTKYVFYKPVLYRQGSDQNFVRGVVRVDITTELLLKAVASSRSSLVFTSVIIALIAVSIGAIGSLVLASIIVNPIRRLAEHVALIRDTEDKETLAGKDIVVKTRDEIGLLGETVNDMTQGLVKAAAAAKDLTVGKELQKMFIPLEVDPATGKKMTTGSTKDDNVEFFGYYEGAKGVSGDYFDYKKLDNRHYAIIKCDVAGKGVPASLIMVEVATLYIDYFQDWKYEKNGYKLNVIVSKINDMIESRGFKGRFAAFTLCIFDSVSGDLHFCNAGDSLLHIYDAATKTKKTINIPETPAAGTFPSFMVEMKGGFKNIKMNLKSGDVLFLYTDGIEEAKRMFRDSKLNNIVCAEPGLPAEAPHESHSVGQESEEMGPERVNALIEAIYAKKVYRLIKWHNSIEDELLEFDFSDCDGSVAYCITALVSVEKIFRMYRDPAATEYDRVLVDKKIDNFLNQHFRQYANYCSNRREHAEEHGYLWYTHIKEDPQYDDLTLLGLKKL